MEIDDDPLDYEDCWHLLWLEPMLPLPLKRFVCLCSIQPELRTLQTDNLIMESAFEVRQMNFLYALTIYLIQIRTRAAGECKRRLARMSVRWRGNKSDECGG
jgi:hypothetical protein